MARPSAADGDDTLIGGIAVGRPDRLPVDGLATRWA
jgi:hypothetical protein